MVTDVKDRIAEAVERHAKKTGLDKVTVNAVVSECNISRQAFYYYYQDIVDVARYLMREKLKLTQETGENAAGPRAAVKSFAEEFAAQFPVVSIMLNSKLRGEMELLLIGELKEFFYTIFSRQNCGRDLSRKQLDFQSDLLACGLAAYAIEHCNESNFDASVFGELLWDLLKQAYGEK